MELSDPEAEGMERWGWREAVVQGLMPARGRSAPSQTPGRRPWLSLSAPAFPGRGQPHGETFPELRLLQALSRPRTQAPRILPRGTEEPGSLVLTNDLQPGGVLWSCLSSLLAGHMVTWSHGGLGYRVRRGPGT